MAGLLDFDSMTPNDIATLDLGLGLLGSRGNFASSIAQGGNAALQGYQQAKKLDMDRQLQSVQVQMALQNANMMKSAMAYLNGDGATPSNPPLGPSNVSRAFNGGINADASPSVVNSQLQQLTRPQQTPQSRLASMTPEQVAMFNIATGKDLSPLWKTAKEGFERKPGSFYEDTAGNRQYIGDPTKGITVDASGNVGTMPGFLGTTAAITRANKGAETRAVNENTLAPIDRIDPSTGRPYAMTVAQMVDKVSGNTPQQQTMQVGGGVPSGLTSSYAAPSLAGGSSGGLQFRGPDEAASSLAKIEIGKNQQMKANDAGQSYQNALNDIVSNEQALVNRNKQILPLLDKFNTGGLNAQGNLQLGNIVKNTTWLPSSIRSLGDRIAGGDANAGKVLQNQLASAAITTMLDTLNKEGKPNRAIFEALSHAQEGIESGNTTLKDVFELQNRLYQQHYSEQQALAEAIRKGNYDTRTWQADYAKRLHENLLEPAAPLPSAGSVPKYDLNGNRIK